MAFRSTCRASVTDLPLCRDEPAAALIRQLSADDLDIFKAIRLEALRLEPDAFTATAADWERLDDAEWLRRMTADPVFVALRGAKPIGLTGLLRFFSSKQQHRATLVMVYVAAAERGGGVAQQLLDHVVDHARSQGIRQVELRVNALNARALRFYERNGFQTVGSMPSATVEHGVETTELTMMRRID